MCLCVCVCVCFVRYDVEDEGGRRGGDSTYLYLASNGALAIFPVGVRSPSAAVHMFEGLSSMMS